MPQSFFIWNGIDCRAMGITMRGPAAIIRAEERVKHVQLPGVSGDLTETEGADVFNSYIQTVSISVKGGYRVNDVYKWLRGSGYVTFSGEPDKRQLARVIGAITLNRISRNMDRWAGEVQFYCQPLKERMAEVAESISPSGSTIINSGDVMSRPLIKVVTASNSTAFGIAVVGTGTPSINGITAAGLTAGATYWLDSETMEMLNSDKSENLTAKTTGNFPVLGVGSNTVTYIGVSSVEITKRERFL